MLFNTKQTLKQIVTLASKELEQADLFYGHGTSNPWDEACWLVESLLLRSGVEQIDADLRLKQTVLVQIQEVLNQRIQQKKPLAYLLNEAWFAGLLFYVNEDVIIPRSPIAELIKNRFKPLIKNDPNTVLDLCCGSGCIGLATAMEFQKTKLVLSDLSKPALEVAEINIGKHHLTERCVLRQSDLFASIGGSFDLILSNPPYVGEKEYQTLPKEYQHEPKMALNSEQNGLELPVLILQQAADYLSEEGMLILEVGNSWQELVEKYPDAPFLWMDFEEGGEGVCVLTKKQLITYAF